MDNNAISKALRQLADEERSDQSWTFNQHFHYTKKTRHGVVVDQVPAGTTILITGSGLTEEIELPRVGQGS